MKIFRVSLVTALLAPIVTPQGIALDHLPKPWVVQTVIASSAAEIAKTNDLITGRRLTPVEHDYRFSTILPSSAYW